MMLASGIEIPSDRIAEICRRYHIVEMAVFGSSARGDMRPDSDIVSELVAKGEVELGMTVITQILTTPGVDLAGPLPPEVQSFVTFAAGVSSHSRVPDAARQLIKFLTGPAAVAVIRTQGMEPAR